MTRFGIAVLLFRAAVVLCALTPQTTFRIGVEVVELDVSVTRGGRPVAGLQATDFALADNGVIQNVESVTLDRLPLSVAIALDTSSSVSGDRLAHLVQAGQEPVSALREGERAALLTFSHAVQLRVPLTGATGTIEQALTGLKALEERRCGTPSTSPSKCGRAITRGRWCSCSPMVKTLRAG